MIKDNFKGTGSLEQFVSESNKLFSALNNAEVRMPDGYGGEIPRLSINESEGNGSALILDMKDALVFSLENVEFELIGSANFVSKAAYVQDGKLKIRIVATS